MRGEAGPGSDALWIAFVAMQALDGVMTYMGMQIYGLAIEANPLVRWYAAVFGPAVALAGAKLLAIGCGMILYAHARHRVMGLLTLLYLGCAVGPWAHLLWWRSGAV